MDRSELEKVRSEAVRLQLHGFALLLETKDDVILRVCNGIGPSWFPAVLRRAIDALHPSLKTVAVIHDLRYYFGDGTDADFTEANEDFALNGRVVADDRYGWWNPVRYIARRSAARFALLCQEFGMFAYNAARRERREDERL